MAIVRSIHRLVACLLIVMSVAGCQSAAPDAWTQWGGQNRDFRAPASRLASDWPEAGPRQLWTRQLGDGYATIVTDTRRLYTMYRTDDGTEVIVALQPDTGATAWERRYPAPLVDEGEQKRHVTEFGNGPQSTPLLAYGRLYTLGYTGMLSCLEPATGKVIWSHDLYNELGGNFLRFGYSASPIAYDGRIIVPVGGKTSDGTANGLVAFDADDGMIAWRSTDLDSGHSSPILVDMDGEDLLVFYMDNGFFAACPKTGDIRWTYEPQGKFSAAIMSPVGCPDNVVFFQVGGDEQGGCAVKLSKAGEQVRAERLWFNSKIKSALHSPVRIGNTLYGQEGRSEFLVAFDGTTGEVLWKQRGFEQSKCLAVGNQLIILDGKGMLTLATPTREGLDVNASAKLLGDRSWSTPTLSGTTLFLRDNDHIMAVDLGA